MENNPIPIILTLPPSSIKGLRDYLGKKVVIKGMRSYEVITSITLKKEVSGDGITYSRAVFNIAGKLQGDQLQMAKQLAESIKAANKNIDITADDYDIQTTKNQEEFQDVKSGEVPPEFVNVDEKTNLDFQTV